MTSNPSCENAVPAMIKAEEGQTRIMQLFHRYRALRDAAEKHVCTGTGQDEDAYLEQIFYQHSDKIEAEMMALPCTCAADFAAKVIVDTVRGSLYSDWKTGALWQEARALTGSGKGTTGLADIQQRNNERSRNSPG